MTLSKVAAEAIKCVVAAWATKTDTTEDMATLAALALEREGRLVGAAQAAELTRLEDLVPELETLLREATAGVEVADELYQTWQQRAETAEARVAELEAEKTTPDANEAAVTPHPTLGLFLHCTRCNQGEWSAKAEERGWERGAYPNWLCPQCAAGSAGRADFRAAVSLIMAARDADEDAHPDDVAHINRRIGMREAAKVLRDRCESPAPVQPRRPKVRRSNKPTPEYAAAVAAAERVALDLQSLGDPSWLGTEVTGDSVRIHLRVPSEEAWEVWAVRLDHDIHRTTRRGNGIVTSHGTWGGVHIAIRCDVIPPALDDVDNSEVVSASEQHEQDQADDARTDAEDDARGDE